MRPCHVARLAGLLLATLVLWPLSGVAQETCMGNGATCLARPGSIYRSITDVDVQGEVASNGKKLSAASFHATNNVALAGASVNQFTQLTRDGYAISGDSPALPYQSFTAACTIANSFTGSINTGNVLTVTAVASGSVYLGEPLTGAAKGITVTGFITGTGGIGTYRVSAGRNIASGTIAALGDGGAEIPGVDGGCWRAVFPTNDYNPQYWGADRKAVVDSTAAMRAAQLWIGNNEPGGRLNCGGAGNHYLIGSAAVAGVPLFNLTHAVDVYGCYFIAAPMTSTTKIWSINPTTADTDGWGWEYVTVYSPLDTALWLNTWYFEDGGNNQKFIRQLKFHDILVYPSQNRAGSDVVFNATDLGTGLLVQSTLGPNVGLFESFDCFNCGDELTLNGFTIETDGAIAASKTCLNISLATDGAGEFTTNDLACTAYGGMILSRLYGSHIRGGVFECGSGHIASATGAFVTIIGSIDLDIDKVQFQSSCAPSPGALNIDGASRNIEARPIIGAGIGANATPAYAVAAAAFPTTYIETYGRGPNRPYLQANMTANQTGIASSTPTIVKFDTDVLDPSLAYSAATGHFTPTIADGAYYIIATVCINGTWSGAAQIVVQKNNGIGLNANISAPAFNPPAGSSTQCLTASGFAELNGATDYLDVVATGVVSTGSVTVLGSQSSSLSIWRIGP